MQTVQEDAHRAGTCRLNRNMQSEQEYVRFVRIIWWDPCILRVIGIEKRVLCRMRLVYAGVV